MEKKIFQDSMKNDIHVYIYHAKTEKIKGIVQIVHGASEHFLRYGLFAEFLNNNGYTVIGSDILGHGLSTTTNDYVHYSNKAGDKIALESVILVKDYINETYPEVPVYILGHSMGSFIARLMIIKYPEFYNKAIISGTTLTPGLVVNGGIILCNLISLFKGPKYISQMVQKMAIDACPAKMFKDGIIKERNVEWLTKDPKIQDYYASSPMCGQPFTVSANRDMFRWMRYVDNAKNIKLGHLDQPIFFVSGHKDPLSNYGESVKLLVEKFKKIGYRRVQSKLYDDDRHEILNETDNQKVYQDILDYIQA